MEKKMNELRTFLKAYNTTFLSKDCTALREFYAPDNDDLVYFDNHKGNDTFTVDAHMDLLADFFEQGKETESKEVEEISMTKERFFQTDSAACICFYAHYKSFPTPAVRSTLYLEKLSQGWRIKHAHYSFEPMK